MGTNLKLAQWKTRGGEDPIEREERIGRDGRAKNWN